MPVSSLIKAIQDLNLSIQEVNQARDKFLTGSAHHNDLKNATISLKNKIFKTKHISKHLKNLNGWSLVDQRFKILLMGSVILLIVFMGVQNL